jgi:hypothetical protein
MGGASERIYLQFEDLLVKYAHVTKEPNLIKISLDQAARTKSTEITIHDRKIHFKDLWDEQQRRGVDFRGDKPQRYKNIADKIGWENCCEPTRFWLGRNAYSAADHEPKGTDPLILDIPTSANHGSEIELWFYPKNSAVAPRTGWASATIETGLGSVVAFARAKPGLVPGISLRPSQAPDA